MEGICNSFNNKTNSFLLSSYFTVLWSLICSLYYILSLFMCRYVYLSSTYINVCFFSFHSSGPPSVVSHPAPHEDTGPVAGLRRSATQPMAAQALPQHRSGSIAERWVLPLNSFIAQILLIIVDGSLHGFVLSTARYFRHSEWVDGLESVPGEV